MGSWQVPLCAEMKFNELRSSIFCSKKRSKQPTRTFLKRHKRRKRQHTSKHVISHVRGEKCTLSFLSNSHRSARTLSRFGYLYMCCVADRVM